jgi:glycosyltransferase involved in cell wall biosynthesis
MHNCYLWMNDADRQLLAADLAAMDRVIAVSSQIAQFAAAQFGLDAERIIVVPNAVPERLLAEAGDRNPDRFAEPGTPFTVAMVASFVGHKSQHVAIAAFEEVAREDPDLRLQMIGADTEPNYRNRVASQLAASPLRDRIELQVGLSREEALARVDAAQLFLLPSLLEGCSVALLEAAAAGCVCIVSDVGAARDLAVPGGSVVLLPSPLGELDNVSDAQFFAATASDLPEHRANIADALRRVRRDYRKYAAGVPAIRARLRGDLGIDKLTRSYIDTYTMACRGGAALR